MLVARAMAALAIDAFLNAQENWIASPVSIAWNLWIGVVAEHAVVADQPPPALMIRPVVAGIHGPVAALFGIPGQRQLDQGIPRGSVQIRAGVIAGANNEVDFGFRHVGLPAVVVDLVLALEIFPVDRK